MQIVLFIANAILIYLFTAWIVKTIESRRNKPLPNRQIIFFIIFFALILLIFELMKFLIAVPI